MTSVLNGWRVVVTRAVHQADGLVTALETHGARVVRLPLIEITAPPNPDELGIAAMALARMDWLVFTSANAVTAFMPHIQRPLAARCAVVGPATASALASFGITPALQAATPRATGLLTELAPLLPAGGQVMVPQAEDARPELVDGLRAAGFKVRAFTAYSKRLPPEAPSKAQELFADSTIGWVTCTSPRIARHFADLFGVDWTHRRAEMKALSIGPVTTKALRQLGVETVIEAARPSDGGLVEVMIRAVSRGLPLV